MMAGGRPTKYTPELADLICHRVATNPHGIRRICAMYDDLPAHNTIAEWRYKYDEFSTRYLEAREKQSHLLFENAVDHVESIENYTYMNVKTGATCVDPGIVAMQKAIAFQKTHQAARICPQRYDAKQKQEEVSNADALNKVKSLVAEFNKVNESDV